MRETVAQQQPRPREFAHGVPVFGGDPCADQHRVGEGFGRPFRHGVEQHESDHVEGRGGERGRERADGGGVPDPPDGCGVPECERKQRPAEHAPPCAARGVVAAADPEQRHQRRQQGEAAQAEPAAREQEYRKDDRRKSSSHTPDFRCKCSQTRGYCKTISSAGTLFGAVAIRCGPAGPVAGNHRSCGAIARAGCPDRQEWRSGAGCGRSRSEVVAGKYFVKI